MSCIVLEVSGQCPGYFLDCSWDMSRNCPGNVRDYLINGGISEARLTARGYGESEPIADNSTREGKAENRRVELRILDNKE